MLDAMAQQSDMNQLVDNPDPVHACMYVAHVKASHSHIPIKRIAILRTGSSKVRRREEKISLAAAYSSSVTPKDTKPKSAEKCAQV
jgi:purine nucleoside permease